MSKIFKYLSVDLTILYSSIVEFAGHAYQQIYILLTCNKDMNYINV